MWQGTQDQERHVQNLSFKNFMIDRWLIWSLEHKAWWAANQRGYTEIRAEAGIYPFETARKIVKGANIGLHDVPNEAMIEFVEWDILKEKAGA